MANVRKKGRSARTVYSVADRRDLIPRTPLLLPPAQWGAQRYYLPVRTAGFARQRARSKGENGLQTRAISGVEGGPQARSRLKSKIRLANLEPIVALKEERGRDQAANRAAVRTVYEGD